MLHVIVFLQKNTLAWCMQFGEYRLRPFLVVMWCWRQCTWWKSYDTFIFTLFSWLYWYCGSPTSIRWSIL